MASNISREKARGEVEAVGEEQKRDGMIDGSDESRHRSFIY